MKTISLTQALLMSLTIGVAFSSYSTPHHNMCTGKENGNLLPNRVDCSSYFVCNYGVPHLFNCSLNLLFDVDLGVCNWPDKVSCKQIVQQPILPINPNAEPTPRPGQNELSDVASSPGWAPLPPNWPHAPSVPQENDDEGVNLSNNNTNGRPDDGWIDDGWINDDAWVKPAGEIVSNTQQPNTTDVEIYPGIVVKSMNPTTFGCSHDHFYFAPHPTSCQTYFICSNRQLHEHRCGNGIQWNYVQSQCDLVERAVCFSRLQEQQHENASYHGSVLAIQDDSSVMADGGNDTWTVADGIIDPDFGVTSDEVDVEYTSVPPSNDSADEIDDQYTAEPIFNETNEEIDHEYTAEPELIVSTNNGTNEEIDPEFGVTSSEVDAEYTSVPPSNDSTETNEEIDHDDTAVPPIDDNSGSEIDPDFGVPSDEVDAEYTSEPPSTDSSDEIDDQYTAETNEEVDHEYTAVPALIGSTNNGTNEEIDPEFGMPAEDIDLDYTVTPPSDDYEHMFTIGLPEWGYISDSNESANDLPKCPKKEQAFFPHLTDCKKYYICISGEAIITKCPDNLSWDVEISECVDDKKVKCATIKLE